MDITSKIRAVAMFLTSYDLVPYIASDSLFFSIKLKAKYRLHSVVLDSTKALY